MLNHSIINKLSSIQHAALPLGISGFDLILKEKPVPSRNVFYAKLSLELVKRENVATQVVIITPNEAIKKMKEVIYDFGKNVEGLKIQSLDEEFQCMANDNCPILIGSPNKIRQFVEKEALQTKFVRLLILDNANITNLPDFEKIFSILSNKIQIISSSEIYSQKLESFLRSFMDHPLSLSSQVESSTLLGFKLFVVISELEKQNEESGIQLKIDLLLQILNQLSFSLCEIYSIDKNQIINIIEAFKENSNYSVTMKETILRNKLTHYKCLLVPNKSNSKDEISNSKIIINYDVPLDSSIFIQRIEQISKCGEDGTCITLTTSDVELENFREIMGEIGGSTLSIPVLNIDQSLCESNNFKYISGVVKDRNKSNNLKEIIKDIIKIRLEQCQEEGMSYKLKNLNVNKPDLVNSNLKEILEKMAAGNVQEPPNINEEDKKLPPLKTVFEVVSMKINSTQSQQSKSAKVKDFLHDLASGVKVENNSKNRRKPDEVVEKNLALLNVAKLITTCEHLPEKEISEPLDEYLNSLKKSDLTLSTTDSESETFVSDENKNSAEDKNPHLKDIFKIGYDFFIKPKSSNDKELKSKILNDFVDEIESRSEEVNLLDESIDGVEASNTLNINAKADKRKTGSKKNKNKNSKRSRYTENNCTFEVTNKATSLETNDLEQEIIKLEEENVEIERSLNLDVVNDSYPCEDGNRPINEVAESYFNYYSNILWNNGLTFDDVSTFDEWFLQWQAQVESVRDYIQQRIYLEEMNKLYQN